MNQNVIWPLEVQEYVTEVINVISDVVDQQETSLVNLEKELCSIVLEKFLNSEELILTEEEFSEGYMKAMTQTSLDKLIEAGLINFVEDTDGELLYLLTDKGRLLANSISDSSINDSYLKSQVESSAYSTYHLPFEQLN